MESDRYHPLSEYGIVGDLETVGLVSRQGSVDWFPLPDVESPSVFAAILDAERGGHFQVQPAEPYQAAQRYVPRTNVLATDFYVAAGRATLTDFMAFPESSDPEDVLYRKVACTEGSIDVAADFQPRPDYAHTVPEVVETDRGAVARYDGPPVHLSAPGRVTADGDGGARASVTLSEGETAWFTVRYGHQGPHDPAAFQRRLDETVERWRDWLHDCDGQSSCAYGGPWHHLVERSELVLKLLTHVETGAIAAAPTTSLPESVGGTRNWDYRFNWIRDAALTVQALHELGHVAEARSYFEWLLDKVYEEPDSIKPLYGLHGGTNIEERTLDHLRGYRGSAPVRVGNAAHAQRQLDVYGELVLAMFETSRYGQTIERSTWRALREVIDHVDDVWDEPDAGIWEFRTEPRHFVHSKVMCWAALDRGVRVVEGTGFEGPVDRWRESRDAVREAILERGYDPELNSFVQTFEADDALDATALLLPVVGFLPPEDDRVQGTIDAIQRRLTTDRGLVYRYDADDGLPGGEGTFVLCSFWLVDALALSGRVEEARELFDAVLSHASPLGLFAEEIADESGLLLGNFPQAFSHIGLVNSALYLDRAAADRQGGPEPLGQEEPGAETLTAEDPG